MRVVVRAHMNFHLEHHRWVCTSPGSNSGSQRHGDLSRRAMQAPSCSSLTTLGSVSVKYSLTTPKEGQARSQPP